MLYLLKVWLEIKTNNIKLWNGNRKENKQISLAYCKHKYLLKVSKFQNEFRKSLFLLRYERKIVRIPALWCLITQGRNPDNFSFIFWEKRWLRKFFLKFTDLYWSLSFPLWLKEGNSIKRNIYNSIPQPFCSFKAVSTHANLPFVNSCCSRKHELYLNPFHTVSFDWFLSGLEWIINLELEN